MIESWKLKNFKSAQQSTVIPFKTLTVFAGANSSGKSTWLQSMLMIAQTVSSRLGSYSVILNGRLVKLGQFKDVLSDGQTGDITVGWAIDLEDFTGDSIIAKYEICFDSDLDSNHELGQLSPRLLTSKIELQTKHLANEESINSWVKIHLKEPVFPIFIDASGTETAAKPQVGDIKQGNFSVELDPTTFAQLKDELIDAHIVDCKLEHFFPKQLQLTFNLQSEAARFIGRSLIEAQFLRLPKQLSGIRLVIPAEVIDEVCSKLPDTYRVIYRAGREPGEDVPFIEWQQRARQILPTVRSIIKPALQGLDERLQFLLKTKLNLSDRQILWEIPNQEITNAIALCEHWGKRLLRYLGPLRDEPKIVYPFSDSDDPLDVGLKGEHTAAVLHLHRDTEVQHIPSSFFQNPNVSESTPVAGAPLRDAVNDWIRYLDVGESIETSDLGRQGHGVAIQLSGMNCQHDLTHVGVGVSQVLPILVMCLLAPTGSTLIFEQPELHLHPAVQARLADFFISVGLLGVQCVVETHSEYLINRFRYRVAASRNDVISNLLGVHFVSKANGVSTISQVDINPYGAIKHWPDGFFDQSPREVDEILLAAALKRRDEKRSFRN